MAVDLINWSGLRHSGYSEESWVLYREFKAGLRGTEFGNLL